MKYIPNITYIYPLYNIQQSQNWSMRDIQSIYGFLSLEKKRRLQDDQGITFVVWIMRRQCCIWRFIGALCSDENEFNMNWCYRAILMPESITEAKMRRRVQGWIKENGSVMIQQEPREKRESISLRPKSKEGWTMWFDPRGGGMNNAGMREVVRGVSYINGAQKSIGN
jgi:hypothetical protein